MSLVRVFSNLGSVIVPRQGGDGGAPSGRVAAELDSLIAWAKDAPRTIHRFFPVPPVGNIGTGLDTLENFSLPAGTLATDGDFIEIEYGGNYGGNNDDKRVVWSVGGNTHEDTGLIDIDALGWAIRARVVRLSATSVRVHSVFEGGILAIQSDGTVINTGIGGRFNQRGNVYTVSNLASNALALLVQGESSTATNDNVTLYLSIIKLCQQ